MHTPKITNDQKLADVIRLGDERALGKLYDRYWLKLLSIAINRLNSETEAEECVQDVFIGIWRRRELFIITTNMESYLSVAIRNQVMNRLVKRYTKKHNPEPQISEFAYETADSSLLQKELSTLVDGIVSKLPEKCQIVYRLSRLEGKNNKTIAEELNITEKTVEGHLTKAIKTIRKQLSSDISLTIWAILEWYIHSKTKI